MLTKISFAVKWRAMARSAPAVPTSSGTAATCKVIEANCSILYLNGFSKLEEINIQFTI